MDRSRKSKLAWKPSINQLITKQEKHAFTQPYVSCACSASSVCLYTNRDLVYNVVNIPSAAFAYPEPFPGILCRLVDLEPRLVFLFNSGF